MLIDRQCKAAQPSERPYKLADARGLFLHVAPTGRKTWRYKYRYAGKEKQLVLGEYPALSLATARALHNDAWTLVRDGVDPSIRRRQRRAARIVAVGSTVEQFAREWHANKTHGWQPRYAQNVLNRLEFDLIPKLGKMPMADVTVPIALEFLRSIEKRGSLDVAKRMRQHMDDIFSTALITGVVTTNPVAGLQRAMKPAIRGQRPAVRSLAEARQVLTTVEAMNIEPSTRLAARLLALTAVRPAMVRIASPQEFEDLDGAQPVWRIPAAKMKLTARRRNDVTFEFVVPLAPQAVDVVRQALRLSTSELIFPGTRNRRAPMSDSTLSAIYRSAGWTDRHVPHGWRATFSTLMNERAAIENRVGDRDIIDLMLAHVSNSVETTYNRYAYLPRRREIANEWAAMLMDGLQPASALLTARKRGLPEVQHDRGDDTTPDAPAVESGVRKAGRSRTRR